MTLTRARLAEKAGALEGHLLRVASRLPDDDEPFEAGTDASDAVILHLWQATQLVIDVAVSLAVQVTGSAPATYGDAFRALQRANIIDEGLADRLVAAAGFRNVLVHAYEDLDLARVRVAARSGPADLRGFLAVAREHVDG